MLRGAAGAQRGHDDDMPQQPEYTDTRVGRVALSLMKIGCDGALVKMSPQQRIALGLPAEGDIPMARVYGVLTGFTEKKIIAPKDGKPAKETYGLAGNIEALNLMTGEIFVGGVFYLPSGFHEMMMARLNSALDRVSGAKKIKFEIELHATGDSNLAGYSWKLFNRAKPEVGDELAAMRHKALTGSSKKEHQELLAATGSLPATLTDQTR